MVWSSPREHGTPVLVIACVSWGLLLHKLIRLCLCSTLKVSPPICLSMWMTLLLSARHHRLLKDCFNSCLLIFLSRTSDPWIIFLGVEVASNSGGMTLTQRKYAQDILHRVHMENCKPVSTPLCVNISATSLGIVVCLLVTRMLLCTEVQWGHFSILPSLDLICHSSLTKCANFFPSLLMSIEKLSNTYFGLSKALELHGCSLRNHPLPC
jgi:hypothetical protein